MEHFLNRIHDELWAKNDPKHRDQLVWFFKEQTINPIGVRSKDMNRVTACFWKEIKGWSKEQIWALCEGLWKTGILEDGHLACKFAMHVGSQLDESDLPILTDWLHLYIYNWAHCDDLSTHALGYMLYNYPETVLRTRDWHNSDSRWVRRALAVSMIPALKAGNNLKHSLDIADRLLMDDDDLVQKGYGWMLKIASQIFPDEIFQFIMSRRGAMPRTALRYAIEKLPEYQKNEAMKKQSPIR